MERTARDALSGATTWAWIFGVAVAWAVIALFVGVGAMTTYLVAYGGHLPVLLLQMQTLPVVTVGAALAALLLIALPVRLLGMPRVAWLGVPLAQIVVFIALGVAAGATGLSISPEVLRGFATSDLPTALLTAAAAFVGSRVGVRPSAQQAHRADAAR